MPGAIPLLTMIRLTEEIVTEIQKRRCPPAENFIFGIRIQMWPVFQKAMHEHIESLKKLAEGTNSGYFSRTSPITDATVTKVSRELLVRESLSNFMFRPPAIMSISSILSCV